MVTMHCPEKAGYIGETVYSLAICLFKNVIIQCTVTKKFIRYTTLLFHISESEERRTVFLKTRPMIWLKEIVTT